MSKTITIPTISLPKWGHLIVGGLLAAGGTLAPVLIAHQRLSLVILIQAVVNGLIGSGLTAYIPGGFATVERVATAVEDAVPGETAIHGGPTGPVSEEPAAK